MLCVCNPLSPFVPYEAAPVEKVCYVQYKYSARSRVVDMNLE